jgi:small subunit ribosomal protein S3
VGQKVHPYGFRLGTLYGWKSNWFEERRYADQVQEDHQLRRHIKKKLFHAGISKVVIERTGDKCVVNIHTARPGILIGKRGAEVEVLRVELGKFTKSELFINIKEIRKAELDAQLVAENVAMQLERRVAFRRAMKKAMTSTLKFGAKGIRIETSGDVAD